MSIRVDLLGPPVIEVDGRPLRVDTRKATALLAHLCLNGPQARELLVDLLWPDADPERGRSALRRTLSTLRTALGGRWLSADRTLVRLDLDPGAVDVDRFRRLLASAPGGVEAIGALGEAVALYRGDLLAGFGVRDSARFDDWQRDAAAILRGELAAALDRLAAALVEAGRPVEAVSAAERRLALDPLNEAAHRTLIGVYAAAGERGRALHQYRECVRVLDRELGVRPLPETTAVYDALASGDAPPPRPAPAAPRAAPWRPPLVGRAAETAALAALIEERGGDLVVVEGEAGAGKTRLVDEVLAAEAIRGVPVIGARAFEGESGLAYGAIASLLRAALDGGAAARLEAIPRHWRDEAARLVPELGEPPVASGDPAAQQRLHEGIVCVLEAALGDGGGVIWLDDLHAADPASVGCVSYLARRLLGRPVVLIVAWRSEDVGEEHGALRRRAAAVIRPGRLDRPAVAAMAQAAGAAEHADLLYTETEGLPLFVVEYLAGMTAPGGAAEVPVGVRELLAARLDSVSEASAQLVAAAAVIGRSFDVETLRHTSGRDDEETVTGLEELTRAGLLVETGDVYAFSHEKLRDVAYERTSLARRRLLHRRAADALAARRSPPAVVAQHLLAAGRDDDAAQAFRAAGDRARDLHAAAEAIEAYQSALALGDPDQAGLHVELGDLQTLRGDYRAAIDAYEAAAALTRGADLAAVEHRLGRVHDRRGDALAAERHLTEALRLGGERARVQADRSLAARRRGADGAAIALGERALALAEADGDAEAVAQACNILGMLTGRDAYLERAVELAEGLDDRTVLVAALNNLALQRARGGAVAEATELTRRALRLCAQQGDLHREAALHSNLADLLHRAGRDDESMAEARRSAAIFARIGGEAEMQPEVWKLVEW